MSIWTWADSFSTWYYRRKSEAVMRKYGICPRHFVEMQSRLFTDAHVTGLETFCPECERPAREAKQSKDYQELKRAANTLLKGMKDVRGKRS